MNTDSKRKSGVLLIDTLLNDSRLSEAARDTIAGAVAGEPGYEPLSVVTRALCMEEFDPADLAAVAVLTLDAYRDPDAPLIHLDSLLQVCLHALRDMDAAPATLVEAGVRMLATQSGGTMAFMLGEYLRQFGPRNPEYRGLVVEPFTQDNYSLLDGDDTGAEREPKQPTLRDESQWQYEGWNLARDWPFADLFFALDTGGEIERILSSPPSPAIPLSRSLQYLVLRRLWQNKDVAACAETLLGLGRLIRNTAEIPALAGLRERALAVFQNRWPNTIPQGITQLASEVWLQLDKRRARFDPNGATPEFAGMSRLFVALARERESQAVQPEPPVAVDAGIPPSEAALYRKIAALESALREKPDGRGWHELAMLYRDASLWDRAIEAESKALALLPNAAFAYHGRAKARMSLREFAAAVEDFASAIRIWEFPDGFRHYIELEKPPEEYIDSYRTRGVARAHLGDYGAAIADLSSALRLRREDAKLRYERAYLCEKAGRNGEAAADYHRAGLLYFDQRSKVEAAQCADALERLGERTKALDLRARLAPKAPESDLPL